MEFKPRPFDNSDKAIEIHKKQVEEAKKYLFEWMKYAGFEDNDATDLDFFDIASIMADYKLNNK